MKILALVHGLAPEFVGGVERYVEGVARALISRGHEVVIVAGTARVEPRPRLERQDLGEIRVYRLHRFERHVDHWFASDSPAAARMLDRLIGCERPDVMHVHHWKRLTRRAVRTGIARRVPTIVTLHDLWSTCPRTDRLRGPGNDEFCEIPIAAPDCAPCARRLAWIDEAEARREVTLYRRDLRREITAATRALSPSRVHRDFACRMLGLDPGGVDVLPIALPVTPSRRNDGLPPARFPATPLRIVHWGNIDLLKGVHVLLGAVRTLGEDERARVEVHLYGRMVTRDYERRLRELAEGLPVTFHGPFDPRELDPRRFDVAVFPSLAFESHSLVLDEASAIGLPVLVSARGALLERSGGRGLPFEPGSAAALAARIREVMARPAILDDLRARAADPPRLDAHVDALESLYAGAVAAGAGPAPEIDSSGDRHRSRALEARNQTIESLRLEALRLGPVLEDLDRHRALRQELEAEILEQRRVIETLEADLRGHRESLANSTADLERHREVLRARDEDIARRQAAIDAMARELNEFRSVAPEIERDLAGHRQALFAAHAEIERHRADRKSLEEELARRVSAHGAIARDAAAAREDRERLLGELTAIRAAIAAAASGAESEIGAPSDGLAPLERLERALAAISEELRRATARAKALEEEIARYRNSSLPERLKRLLIGSRAEPEGRGEGS